MKNRHVLLAFVENPHESSRRVAQQDGIDQKSVLKILKNNNFYPFEVNLV